MAETLKRRGRPPGSGKTKLPANLSPEERSLAELRAELDRRKEELDDRERMLDERDRIMSDMPDEMNDVQTREWFNKNRRPRLAMMLALANKSASESTRKEMLIRLDDMDLGKPSSQKRDDSEAIGCVIFNRGEGYGISEDPAEDYL